MIESLAGVSVLLLIAVGWVIGVRLLLLARDHPRYGYRRIHVFLERRGLTMSVDRAHRIWRQNGLQVPKKRRTPRR